MTEAIFGLIGVIVGGLLQSGAAWQMERRREDWAARKAGRLLAENLGRCQSVLEFATTADGASWNLVAREIEEALKRWPEHADVLAGAISQRDWNRIMPAIHVLEAFRERGRGAGGEDAIDAQQQEIFRDFTGELRAAVDTCVAIGAEGIRQSPRRRLRAGRVRVARRNAQH